MFKQISKTKKRLTTCRHPKHLFRKNKSKCLCGSYYKENGRIYSEKDGCRSWCVAGTTDDFRYKGTHASEKEKRKLLKKMLRK